MSSEGSPEGGPGVPISQEEAVLELAEACRKDSGAFSLSPEEVKELTGLAVAVVRDPSAPSGQRIQALINKEYDQFAKSLPIPKPEQSSTAAEHNGASSRGRMGRSRGQVGRSRAAHRDIE